MAGWWQWTRADCHVQRRRTRNPAAALHRPAAYGGTRDLGQPVSGGSPTRCRAGRPVLPAGHLMVQVKCHVTGAAPGAEMTMVTFVLVGRDGNAPVITPVAGLMPTPAGRPVAV